MHAPPCISGSACGDPDPPHVVILYDRLSHKMTTPPRKSLPDGENLTLASLKMIEMGGEMIKSWRDLIYPGHGMIEVRRTEVGFPG